MTEMTGHQPDAEPQTRSAGSRPCPHCAGTKMMEQCEEGFVWDEPCRFCDGTGKAEPAQAPAPAEAAPAEGEWHCRECGKPQSNRDSFGHVCDACHRLAMAKPSAPAPTAHVCPYGGWRRHPYWIPSKQAWEDRIQGCGYSGYLCDRCREDRADARQRELFDFMREAVKNRIAANRCTQESHRSRINAGVDALRDRLDDLAAQVSDRCGALDRRADVAADRMMAAEQAQNTLERGQVDLAHEQWKRQVDIETRLDALEQRIASAELLAPLNRPRR
jgi:hypothetical protein